MFLGCWILLFSSIVSLSFAYDVVDYLGQLINIRNETTRIDDVHQDYPIGIQSAHEASTGIINSDNIYEWTPIATNISAGGRDIFIFSVDTESSGLGIAPTYEILIFLSGNLCSQPSNTTERALAIYYSFNESVTTDSSAGQYAIFQNGYLQALAISPLQISSSNTTSKYAYLYVVVEPVNTTTGGSLPLATNSIDETWEYRLSISENDLVYQWDTRSWLDVIDTDHNSALLTTGNLSADAKEALNFTIYDSSLYDIYIYAYEDSFKFDIGLNISLCAITNGPYLVSSAGSSNTTNVSHSLERTELAIQKSLTGRSGSVQEQFYITGLNSSSTYVAYLTKKIAKQGNLSDVGGVLFSREYFSTRDTNVCSLIFGLDFCSGVAYSVPSSSLAPNNKTFIANAYDQIAQSLYGNFSKALQIIPCDSELDARYSPIRTCQDCSNSYLNWLCAVSIPRCSNEETEYYVYRQKDDNRNKYLNEDIRPIGNYYEVLPCIEMCYDMVRDCPSDFGFACPDKNSQENLLLHSYNFFDADNALVTCNFIGNETDLFISLGST